MQRFRLIDIAAILSLISTVLADMVYHWMREGLLVTVAVCTVVLWVKAGGPRRWWRQLPPE